jgi:phosphoglycerol transferase
MRRDRTWRTLAAYCGAAALSLAAGASMLEIWRADLRVPFDYGGDSLVSAFVVQSTIEQGWFLNNPRVGAPGGLHLYDFPMTESFHVFAFKVMSALSSDWALLLNVYFLLGFPLITVSALAVFRQFGVRWGPALVGSVLYAFLPSRLLKGEAHLFLDVFFQVPLAMMVVIWVCGDAPPLVRDRAPGRWPGLELRRGRSVAALLICALTASTGIYYAFFTAALLVAGGLWASLERRSVRNALAGAALAGALCAGIGANVLPTIVYHLRHGPNPQVAVRLSVEAEYYGMKIAQLLLPVPYHRVHALRALRERYSRSDPLLGEMSVTTLGVTGAVGFLALLVLLLVRPRPEPAHEELWRPLGVLNLMAVLLATTGGFGSLFALLVTPQIRTYCRMNVIIAFFALFAVVLLLERLGRRFPRVGSLALPVVLGVGLFDQTTSPAVRRYAEVKKVFDRDAAFVHRIEAGVSKGTAIFQLPYVTFPESGGRHHISDYDGIRPYLHSRFLRWSYPTMRGRAGDFWATQVSSLPPRALVETLGDAGMGGILVDRFGYPDNGQLIESELRALLGASPLVSAGDRLAFFDLATTAQHAHDPPAERERRRELALHPLVLNWSTGFYGVETDGDSSFRWASETSTLQVENDLKIARDATLVMTIVAAKPPARLIIDGDLLPPTVIIVPPTGFELRRALHVLPGHHLIRFHCEGGAATAPLDPRILIWRAVDFALESTLP